MSVRTPVDESLEETRQHVKDSVRKIGEMLTRDFEILKQDYNDSYINKLKAIFNKLLEIREDLQ